MVSEPLKKLETTKRKKPLKGAISCACVDSRQVTVFILPIGKAHIPQPYLCETQKYKCD